MAPRRRRLDVNVIKENDILKVIERRVQSKASEMKNRNFEGLKIEKERKVFETMYESFKKKLATKFSVHKDGYGDLDRNHGFFSQCLGPISSTMSFSHLSQMQERKYFDKINEQIVRMWAEYDKFIINFHLAQMKEQDTAILVEEFLKLVATY